MSNKKRRVICVYMYVHVHAPKRSFLKVGDLKYEYSQAFLRDTDQPTQYM